mmetsp:Transcript_22746/g.33591  ORF Transcript_22746/g.33591 Transcript_22746/m.33591 type:complete len:370 (-) Transcript_22746:9-1118(-)
MSFDSVLLVAILLALSSISSVEGGKTIRILTQNVKFIVTVATTISKRAKLIAESLLRKDPLYDVIAFQEVFSHALTHEGLSLLLEGLEGSYPYHVKLQPNIIPFMNYDSGLLIVSRYPIELLEFHEYKNESGMDAWASKGIMVAMIDAGDESSKLIVGNTHLNAGGKSVTVRQGQILEASNAFKRIAIPERTAVFAVGDFNTKELDKDGTTTDSYTFLMETLSDNTIDLFRKANGIVPLGSTIGHGKRLDYVFGLDKIGGRHMSASYKLLDAGVDNFTVDENLSDHRGAYAVIELSNATNSGKSSSLKKDIRTKSTLSNNGDVELAYTPNFFLLTITSVLFFVLVRRLLARCLSGTKKCEKSGVARKVN